MMNAYYLDWLIIFRWGIYSEKLDNNKFDLAQYETLKCQETASPQPNLT